MSSLNDLNCINNMPTGSGCMSTDVYCHQVSSSASALSVDAPEDAEISVPSSVFGLDEPRDDASSSSKSPLPLRLGSLGSSAAAGDLKVPWVPLESGVFPHLGITLSCTGTFRRTNWLQVLSQGARASSISISIKGHPHFCLG